ncbi:hypothetical protein [Micromonospora deserti]|uniref:hypothetical protein n=1 Tax=Micromonospora deserti TaxID=2070366 RepID=UPI0013144688|nr:hypothetical protein [Micromonospora deserti]
MTDLVGRLTADSAGQRALDLGGQAIARAFATSYEPLDEVARRVFRLLAIFGTTSPR